MNVKPPVTLISALCFGSVALAQQSPDELKQRVLSQARSLGADDYAFTRTVRAEGSQGGKTEKKVTVERFDPTKPVDARWSLVSVDGSAPSAEELSTFRKEVAKRRFVPGYHRLADYFGSPATVSSVSKGRTLFRFDALPKDTVRVLETDISQNATAEASVTDADGVPFAEQVRITVRPMRLKLVMKLQKFESTARYRMGPEGKPLLFEQTSDMSGSGMGQEGTMHTVATYSDYRAVNAVR